MLIAPRYRDRYALPSSWAAAITSPSTRFDASAGSQLRRFEGRGHHLGRDFKAGLVEIKCHSNCRLLAVPGPTLPPLRFPDCCRSETRASDQEPSQVSAFSAPIPNQ